MIRVLKVVDPKCCECIGASYNPMDCVDCKRKITEITLCMNCTFRDESIMHREKLLCTKLHAWVEPYEFCAWGSKELEDE